MSLEPHEGPQEKPSLTVGCLAQGVPDRQMTYDDAIEWVEAQLRFWDGLTLDETLIDPSEAGSKPRTYDLSTEYKKRLTTIVSPGGLNPRALEDYLKSAGRLGLILAEGRMGQRLPRLREASPKVALKVARVYSQSLFRLDAEDADDAALLTIREIALFSAPGLANDHLEAADAALKKSQFVSNALQVLQDRTAGELENFASFVADSRHKIESLERVYDNKLKLSLPAQYWEGAARRAYLIGGAAFVAFIALLAVPAYLATANWPSLHTFILELVAAAGGQFSLTPLVAVSVPVLAYGWLLRHVSRIFIQNLALADDATSRKVMTLTFLGLQREESTQVTDTERALILNALFRPAPPHTADDGPPNGLLDLLKKP